MPVIGVDRKLAIDPVSFSRATPSAVIIAGISDQQQHDDAGDGRINALERLVVAKAGLDIHRQRSAGSRYGPWPPDRQIGLRQALR